MGSTKEDQISRKTIYGWLENYQSLIACDKRADDMPHNSGCKPDDGIMESVLNRIVLVDALEKLQWSFLRPLYRYCKVRWIDGCDVRYALGLFKITKDQYYRRCEWAVSALFYIVNNRQDRLLKLYKKIGKWAF